MSKPHIVFVVGHSNWGKSQTLRALTDGDYKVRRATISGIEYFIRRMSNDDRPKSFIELMEKIHPDKRPNVLAALCPDFDDPKKKTADVLQALKGKGYKLFFWVICKKFGEDAFIQSKEISRLRTFGKVELFGEEQEAGVRSKKFKAYIASIGEA